METQTLKTTLAEPENQGLRDAVSRKLVGVQMLACIQNNLMDDIRRLLEEKGKYRYELKHNLKQIQALCRRNMQHDHFFGALSDATLDAYFKDYERLEEMVYQFLDSDE